MALNTCHAAYSPSQTLDHLRWMLQKDALGQDVFLIGPPGPRRREIAMAFCEVCAFGIAFATESEPPIEFYVYSD